MSTQAEGGSCRGRDHDARRAVIGSRRRLIAERFDPDAADDCRPDAGWRSRNRRVMRGRALLPEVAGRLCRSGGSNSATAGALTGSHQEARHIRIYFPRSTNFPCQNQENRQKRNSAAIEISGAAVTTSMKWGRQTDLVGRLKPVQNRSAFVVTSSAWLVFPHTRVACRPRQGHADDAGSSLSGSSSIRKEARQTCSPAGWPGEHEREGSR